MSISKRDWAQISAYLDGELSQRELIKLETRIVDNPDLQAALEDLKTVKVVLSQVPRLSVPRNFTLKPNLVQSPQRRSPIRGYRLAAAALSFLFIGVVVLDIGSGALKSGSLAARAPMAEEVMLESAADEMEEPAMKAAEEIMEGDAAPVAEMEQIAEVPEDYDSLAEGESEGMDEWQTATVEEEVDRAVGGGEESEDAVNLLSQDNEIPSEEVQLVPEQETDRLVDSLHIPWLRILEVTLGLGAVGFGVAAWMRRRKDRNS